MIVILIEKKSYGLWKSDFELKMRGYKKEDVCEEDEFFIF